jgi:DNA-binding transcriptional ArsR family regulator
VLFIVGSPSITGMSTHIATLGENTAHVLTAYRELKGWTTIHLVTSTRYQKNAEELSELFKQLGVVTVIHIVDPFAHDALDTTTTVMIDIVRSAKDEVSFNITGGTNLMGAIALSCAYFTGSRAYYILDPSKSEDHPVVELPIPRINYADSITSRQYDVLSAIGSHSPEPIRSVGELAAHLGYTSQRLLPHLNNLERMNLITIDRSGRNHGIRITRSGLIMLQFK